MKFLFSTIAVVFGYLLFAGLQRKFSSETLVNGYMSREQGEEIAPTIFIKPEKIEPKKPSFQIRYPDFEKVDIRAGTVLSVEEFPEARKPAYKMVIDFGPSIGQKKTSAQITHHYPEKEKLIGTQVMAVVNFPPKQIGPFQSEVLVLGFPDDENHVILVRPEKPVANGHKLF